MEIKLRSRWEKIRLGYRWLWWKIQQHPFIAIGILIVLVAFALAVYSFGWDWTGFNGGYNKVTETSTVNGKTVATEKPAARTLWDGFQLASSIVTALAILAGGWWFFKNRSLASTAEIALSLKDVTIVNGIRIAIVGVRIKNLGHTRIIKDHCYSNIKTIDVWPNPDDPKPAWAISEEEPFRPSYTEEIFKSLKEIEPNEEISWDIAFALKKPTLFMVLVEFKQKGASESWRAVLVFNADDSKLK